MEPMESMEIIIRGADDFSLAIPLKCPIVRYNQ